MRACSTVAIALVSVAASARADDGACAHVPRGLDAGPVGIGYFEGDLGTGRRACPRSELTLRARAGLVIDSPSLYGAVDGGLLLGGSLALRDRGELFATLETVHYAFVDEGGLTASKWSLGHLTVGGSGLLVDRARVALAPWGRLLLPTATDSIRVRTVGADAGLALDFRPRGPASLRAWAGGDFSAGLSAAPAFPRGGGFVGAGLELRALHRFALELDLDAHFGRDAAVDVVAPSLALRLRMVRGLGLSLAGSVPVAGAERRLAMAMVSLWWQFAERKMNPPLNE